MPHSYSIFFYFHCLVRVHVTPFLHCQVVHFYIENFFVFILYIQENKDDVNIKSMGKSVFQ